MKLPLVTKEQGFVPGSPTQGQSSNIPLQLPEDVLLASSGTFREHYLACLEELLGPPTEVSSTFRVYSLDPEP